MIPYNSIKVNHKRKLRYKERRRGKGERRRSCHDGEGEKKGEIWFTTLPMFTNANGKRKCRRMRPPAVILIMRRKMAFSAPFSVSWQGNPLPVLFLLSCVRNAPFCGMPRCRFSGFRSLASFSFFLLSVPLCFCPSSFCLRSSSFSSFSFFFFQGKGGEICHSACGRGKNEEGKVTFAFSFFFPERRKEMRSFRFMMKGKEKRTFSVLFSSSASAKKHSFRSFFFFLKKGSVLSPVFARWRKGRFTVVFFFFFLLSVRKRQTIPAYGRWRSLLFSFRFQEKKRRHNDFRQ